MLLELISGLGDVESGDNRRGTGGRGGLGPGRRTTALAVGLAMSALPAVATHVEPETIRGNPTCSGLISDGIIELKVEPVADGTFSDGTLTVTIDVRDTADGPVFDWTSNIGVDAVFVKGGPNGNLYVYDPEATADTGLHAPVNPANDKFFGLSHVSFCYDTRTSTWARSSGAPRRARRSRTSPSPASRSRSRTTRSTRTWPTAPPASVTPDIGARRTRLATAISPIFNGLERELSGPVTSFSWLGRRLHCNRQGIL
jgi:hypothetical protein